MEKNAHPVGNSLAVGADPRVPGVLAVRPEHAHVEDEHVQPGDDDVDGGQRRGQDHPLGEVDAVRAREGALEDALEREIGAGADEGRRAAECRGVRRAQEVGLRHICRLQLAVSVGGCFFLISFDWILRAYEIRGPLVI